MNRIIWNPEKCTGCRICEAICSFVKEGEFNPVKSRGRVVRTTEHQVHRSIWVACLQCEDAPCKAVCPTRAIIENDASVKIVVGERCIGCKMCEIACPVGAITVNPEIGTAIKCDLCASLEEPQCVKYCFTEALQYLPAERVGITRARAKSVKYLEMATKEM
ncbi:MAG: 4Fe-4S dicluster domain-containing protein [Chloroflexi bacterium]|nr:4Fe-4S dicluster domain-containing protein [Chloroflexota bacterium]